MTRCPIQVAIHHSKTAAQWVQKPSAPAQEQGPDSAAAKKEHVQPGWAEFVAEKLRALNNNPTSIMAPILTADPLGSLFRSNQPQMPERHKPSFSRMSSVSSTASTLSIPAHLLPPLPVTSNDAGLDDTPRSTISYPVTAPHAQMQRPPSTTRQYYASDLPAPRGSLAHRPALRPLAPKAFLSQGQPRYIVNPFSMV